MARGCCTLLRRGLPGLTAWLAVAFAPPGRAQQTTVPIYLPAYGETDWSVLRGSVITSNGAETSYTIFCADSGSESCQIAGDLPFTFAEGPATLHYAGTITGSLTEDLACNLAGTTAATCTGYSSLGPGYHEGPLSGPTSTQWTTTLTGSAVQWGILTLEATPTGTDSMQTSAGIDGPGSGLPETVSTTSITPSGAPRAADVWSWRGLALLWSLCWMLLSLLLF